jgi:hypothetical protein
MSRRLLEDIIYQSRAFEKADIKWKNESGYFDGRPSDDDGISAMRARDYSFETLEEEIN